MPEETEKIYNASEGTVVAEIILAPEKYGGALPRGSKGEVRRGYSFYELREGEDGVMNMTFLTSRIIDKPTLEAVIEPEEWKRIQRIKKEEERILALNKTQYGQWKRKKIIARPVEFMWQEDNGIWEIKADNQL